MKQRNGMRVPLYAITKGGRTEIGFADYAPQRRVEDYRRLDIELAAVTEAYGLSGLPPPHAVGPEDLAYRIYCLLSEDLDDFFQAQLGAIAPVLDHELDNENHIYLAEEYRTVPFAVMAKLDLLDYVVHNAATTALMANWTESEVLVIPPEGGAPPPPEDEMAELGGGDGR